MLKIHQIFLIRFITIFLSVFISVTIVIFFWIKNSYLSQIKNSLSNNISSFIVGLDTLANIEQKTLDLKRQTGFRVTVIDEQGIVIAESDKDKNFMDNHLYRDEIINIDKNGIGSTIRKSNSINKKILNVVKKTTIDGKIVYIRVGSYLDEIENRFISLTIQIVSIFMVFIVITLLVVYVISNRLRIETTHILEALNTLSKKNGAKKLDLSPDKKSYAEEFYKIRNLLIIVSQKLQKREKIKSKYTAKLKLANQQKYEIISAISHEFKNPISIISGYSESILNDPEMLHQTREKFLRKIYITANRMVALIDRIRFAIKLDQTVENLTLKPTLIKKIIDEIIEELKERYKNRDIVFEYEDIVINIDEMLMRIAIYNLVENALKYSNNQIKIVLNKNSISIIDSGDGIDLNELEKIKDKFYRASNNNRRNSLGLGLFIVSKVVKIHHFSLNIKSAIGKGSTFSILFSH